MSELNKNDEKEQDVEFISRDDGEKVASKADDFVQSGKDFLNKSKGTIEDGFKKIQDNENVQKGLDKGKELFEKGVDAATDLTDKGVDYVKNNESLKDVAYKIGEKVEDVVESEPVQKAVTAVKDLFTKKGDN